jgi:hypothetical protein
MHVSGCTVVRTPTALLNSAEILLKSPEISGYLRFLAGVHVFEAVEIQIRQQILKPCLLLDSGPRDYEIKLDRGFSVKVEQVYLTRNYRPEISSHHDPPYDSGILAAENPRWRKGRQIAIVSTWLRYNGRAAAVPDRTVVQP